jgi:hypothetical protein
MLFQYRGIGTNQGSSLQLERMHATATYVAKGPTCLIIPRSMWLADVRSLPFFPVNLLFWYPR